MNQKSLHQKSRILLLLLQIILMVICLGYMQYIYYRNILPDKIVTNSYQNAQCVVTDKKISSKGKIIPQYRADFLITYQAGNGQKYNTWVSGNGLDSSFSNLTSQQKILNEFTVGQTYPCWYNAQTPEIAVLVIRHNWTNTFHLIIPAIFFLIIFYYFIRTISHTIFYRKHK